MAFKKGFRRDGLENPLIKDYKGILTAFVDKLEKKESVKYLGYSYIIMFIFYGIPCILVGTGLYVWYYLTFLVIISCKYYFKISTFIFNWSYSKLHLK